MSEHKPNPDVLRNIIRKYDLNIPRRRYRNQHYARLKAYVLEVVGSYLGIALEAEKKNLETIQAIEPPNSISAYNLGFQISKSEQRVHDLEYYLRIFLDKRCKKCGQLITGEKGYVIPLLSNRKYCLKCSGNG